MIETVTDLFWNESFRHWFYWLVFMIGLLGILGAWGKGASIKDIVSFSNKKETHNHYDSKEEYDK